MERFLEIPVADALALDEVLGRSPGIPKLRQELIHEFGWNTHRISLGKWGSLSLNAAPLLGCVATAWRWDRARAMELGKSYNDAGLRDLLHTPEYSRAMDLVKASLRAAMNRLAAPPNMPRLLWAVMTDLIGTNSEVRCLAEQVAEITSRVDCTLGQMQRFLGHLERIEGEEALVVLESARKELRAVHPATLAATGIEQPGEVFVLYQYQWSPDTVTSLYIPAVLVEAPSDRQARLDALARDLTQHETPLPQRSRVAAVAAGPPRARP